VRELDNQLQIPTEVRTFLEGLLQDGGITTLDDNMHEEMIKELYARLDNLITTSIIENMPPEKLDVFIRMNEEKRPKEEVEQFLKDNLPNFSEVLSEAFIKFREVYLGNLAVKQAAPQPDGIQKAATS